MPVYADGTLPAAVVVARNAAGQQRKERMMQEQLLGQLVQALQDRAGLDPEKAQQVAQVVTDFAQQHAGELMGMVTGGGGEGGGGLLSSENVQGMLGKLMGR